MMTLIYEYNDVNIVICVLLLCAISLSNSLAGALMAKYDHHQCPLQSPAAAATILCHISTDESHNTQLMIYSAIYH